MLHRVLQSNLVVRPILNYIVTDAEQAAHDKSVMQIEETKQTQRSGKFDTTKPNQTKPWGLSRAHGGLAGIEINLVWGYNRRDPGRKCLVFWLVFVWEMYIPGPWCLADTISRSPGFQCAQAQGARVISSANRRSDWT